MTNKTRNSKKVLLASLVATTLAGTVIQSQDAMAQFGRAAVNAGWSTTRGDAQRTAWVRTDQYISSEDLMYPGFGLQWSRKISNVRGERISEGISNNTAQLNPSPGDLVGSGDNMYGYEIDKGFLVWNAQLDEGTRASRSGTCPGNLTAGVTREAPLTGGVTGGTLGRSGGMFGAARGDVGAPGEGIPANLTEMGFRPRLADAAANDGPGAAAGGPGAAAGGPGAAAGGPGAAAGGPGGGGGGAPGGPGGFPGMDASVPAAYTVSSNGQLRVIGQSQGKEVEKPVQFLPEDAHASSITVIGKVAYATTINDCGDVANGLWSLDMENNNAVKSWGSGASPVGAPAFSADGTVYVAVGSGSKDDAYSNAVVALDPATLAVKDWFTADNADFATGPVVTEVNGKEMVVAATQDGRVYLLDAASLGGANHQSAVAVSASTNSSKNWAPSALAAWQDADGTNWVLVPGSDNVTALKVSGNSLQAGWTSSTKFDSPSAPIVVNDAVFVLEQGSSSRNPAVLYALDGSNGQELWNSGDTLQDGSVTPIWSISGQVYVATTNGVVSAFGYSQDRALTQQKAL